MDGRFRRQVTLTEEERRRFEELASEFSPRPRTDGVRIRFPRAARPWMALGRRSAAVLLIPLGLLTMAVAVVTWWPLGLLGLGLLGPGIHAANGVLGDRLKRVRLMSRFRTGGRP